MFTKIKEWCRTYENDLMIMVSIALLCITFGVGTKTDTPPKPVEATTIQTTAATTEPPESFLSFIFTQPTPPETSAPETTTVTSIVETEPEIPPRYGFTDDDIYILAVVLSGSKHVHGDGEYDIDGGNDTRYDQISLVLGVIMNRVRSPYFPSNVQDVVWQKNQFLVMNQWSKGSLPSVSDISLKRVREWCEAYDRHDSGIQTIPEDHIYFWGDGRENHSYAGQRG